MTQPCTYCGNARSQVWDELDDFSQIIERQRHPERWWVWAGLCQCCNTAWLLGSDERVNGRVALRRLSDAEWRSLTQTDLWPADFDRYIELVFLTDQAGSPARLICPEPEWRAHLHWMDHASGGLSLCEWQRYLDGDEAEVRDELVKADLAPRKN